MRWTRDWRFQLGDEPGAQDETFDDTAWRVLDLPHDWSIEGDVDEANPAGPDGAFLPTGRGWYRKRFQAPADWKDKCVFIAFEGVYRNSTVWVNGHELGTRPYGYVGFIYDLTPHLRPGDANVVAVRVDNQAQPASRWYTGSGIYRPVHLHVLDPGHIAPCGVFPATRSLTADAAALSVEITVVNRSAAARRVRVASVLLDARGQEAARAEMDEEVDAHGEEAVSQELHIANPRPWCPYTPYLYTLRTELRDECPPEERKRLEHLNMEVHADVAACKSSTDELHGGRR